ncbi:Peptidyl-prolyl cis-trans isomerase [Quillaja saponaria]|uniref:Peptidyl-prolyl cis-trans isomerase n=1 Tax=Quillaja saponaria TaxID=32244 RepID=A0AAD7LFR9_QUISA|nr:Peptidyl-prolyl cis-trans isomerase [Quillaja saponaria]
MLQNPKVLPSSPQSFHPPTPTPSQIQCRPTSPSLPIINHHSKLSRRELTICSNSCLLLVIGSQALEPPNLSKARAEENLTNTSANGQQEENSTLTPGCNERIPTKQAFLDISIDGEPVGRITIGLYGNDVPTGAARFSNLVSGAAGISYRRKEFIKIMPNYVQHGGVRSYGVDAELAKETGGNLATESLIEEWERSYEECAGTKNLEGSVSIVVRDPSKPPPKLKLVARKGKLEIDQEEVGTDPNGTEFVITTKDSPELDASALVVGKVVGGMEVVKRIGEVKTVQENTSSPYFRVAKLIGDKRAVVAERGFNRPFSRVIVTNCGLMK